MTASITTRRVASDRSKANSSAVPSTQRSVAAHRLVDGAQSQSTAVAAAESAIATAPQPRRLGWLANWYFWGVLGVVACSGAGTVAALSLFGVPALPNCPAIFWPLAPASLRFECARLAASKRTAKDLLEAIALLDSLPENHSLREEANRLIEQWSDQVLDQTEEIFNQGKLQEAIAAARKILPKTSAYRLVEDRVKRWESIWAEAENIYRQAETELRRREYRRAFDQAIRLLTVENQFWQTTRYDGLIKTIDIARNDGNQLYEAERLANNSGAAGLLKALKLAESIKPNSYVYRAAQKVLAKIGRKMLVVAQASLNRRDLQGALNLLGNVPNLGNLKSEAQDLTILANAQYQAWQGSTADIEEAIAQAQQIGVGRPLAQKAQQWIARWRQEIEAIAKLRQAQDLARSGNLGDLSAAIAQASTVSDSNPRREEVEKQINEWRNQIQTTEDQPILAQAEQSASAGDVAALQTAISQAQQIGRGRALYAEAREKIRQWRSQLQEIKNQPYLEQARQYANAGDLPLAIQVAAQIPRGEALYPEAQAEIRNWRQTLKGQADQAESKTALLEARQVASAGTPDGLAAAIAIANRVAPASSLRAEADEAIDQWSWQLLQIATNRATSDPVAAIAIAQKIPTSAAAYTQAQQQIQEWRQ